MKRLAACCLSVYVLMSAFGQAPAARPSAQIPAPPLYKLDDAFLRWSLPPERAAYKAIDGKHIHESVEALTAISRKYRDDGHPQFWGRIIGTSADAETAQWALGKLKQFGLTDARIQPFDLPPQWMPQSWSIVARAGDKTLKLDYAQPAYQTPATPAEGLDLEAVYVGTGSRRILQVGM